MAAHKTLRKGIVRVVLFCLISLFLIPAVTLAFARFAIRDNDATIVQAIERRIDGDERLSPERKARNRDFYRSHPPSAVCDDADPEVAGYRDAMCSTYSMLWQLRVADRVSFWTLAGGAALLAAALLLGAMAFVNRGLRYASFVAGWRLMTIGSALEVVMQGTMCVWLSFWVTAYFFQEYFIKLVGGIGLLAAVAAFVALRTLYRKFPFGNSVDGEVVAETDAPRLWDRVRQLAQRLGTAPPDQIVAGIDANFFVTEAPCTVADRTLTGRTLFISIPLLRVLDPQEADAVLAHELAHLHGGDTGSSAALGPKLVQYDQYTAAMRSGGLTLVAHHLLRLYRMIFAFALARDSREREFKADRVAAKLVSPAAIAQSLIKIAAYASYRSEIERKLFAHDRQHETLGIAGFVASGLHPYAGSAEFLDAMRTANVPHPFDSHPLLPERMRNVEHPIVEHDYGAVVTQVPASTWADEILTASGIEQRLWQAYEEQFAQAHEQALAYRYEPAGDAERAVVLKYFPPLTFSVANGRTIEVSVAGLHDSGSDAPIAWDAVKALTFKSSTFGDTLVVTHPEKTLLIAKSTTLKLRGLKKQTADFKAAVGHYWQRHQVMRQQQLAASAAT